MEKTPIEKSSDVSLRDYFAARCLPPQPTTIPDGPWQWVRKVVGLPYSARTFIPECVARTAYRVADAMLEERANDETKRHD